MPPTALFNVYVMDLRNLFDEIFLAAAHQGVSKAELYRRAGLHQSAVSRAMSNDDCRFSTLNRLLEAGGLKLVVVQDTSAADKLAKGTLF